MRKNLLAYVCPIVALVFLRLRVHVNLCDDAYISLRVAENLALGHGMVFNPNEHSYVTTSPAWVVLLAVFRFIVGDVALAARVLGVISELLLVIAMVHHAGDTVFGKWAGAFGAVLLITNPVFLLTSLSGMELPLSLLLLVVNAHFLATRRFAAASVCAAVSVWVRFDGIVFLIATLGIILVRERSELTRRPLPVLGSMAPAAAGLLLYVVFGELVFKDWIPMSVRTKAATAHRLFSSDWTTGAIATAKEFWHACVGQSAYWYRQPTPFVIVPIIAALGLALQFRKRDGASLPLAVLSLAYAASYVGAGSQYTINFPWYFAPILPFVCLAAGTGVASGALTPTKRPLFENALGAALLFGWVKLSVAPLDRGATALEHDFTRERERSYASVAVWLGKHLKSHALIAANEIGTIGFFLPAEYSVLDMFGLLRTPESFGVPYPTLVEQMKPECIVTGTRFSYRKNLEGSLKSQYTWHTFRRLSIGIRSDLQTQLGPAWSELATTYRMLTLDAEYPWKAERTQ